MEQITVYNKMTTDITALYSVLKEEIGLKVSCQPFAIKAIEALKSLGNLTESRAINAANIFLNNLQSLTQAGIIPEDYDKIDMVKRGDTITISARVEALLRAASRKGYRITDTIIAVPKEDSETTYFKENFYNGYIIYTLEDKRIQGDRTVTAERLVSNYFSKFICRLDIFDIKTNKRVLMTTCEMANSEILKITNSSDYGIFISKWINKQKVITNELNINSIWYKWTSEMVAKSIIRRALKRVRETIPALTETIYAFDDDSFTTSQEDNNKIDIDIPLEEINVDLNNLTEQQHKDVKEMFNLFSANPKLAENMANEIIQKFNGNNAQKLINTYYASIYNMLRSNKLKSIISPLFESTKPIENPSLNCSVCGQEIKSEKSKLFYLENPNEVVKCYTCSKDG